MADLELTDDTDENNGNEIVSPNIAMYTRAIPWKPSNSNCRVNLTTLDTLNTNSKLW